MNTARLLRAPYVSSRILQPKRLPFPSRTYSTKPSDPAPPEPHAPSQPPPPPPKQPSRVGTFYRNNTYPVLKSFLVALFTYQLAYFVWLKLEIVEEKNEQKSTIRGLEEEVKKAAAQQKRNLEDVAERVVESVDVRKDEKKKGWFGW